jgi:transposase
LNREASLLVRSAVTGRRRKRLVVEVGDIRRFDHPRQLMAFLGLVPSEYSSGPSVRRGGITKPGNPHARRLLAEAAWAYQGSPRLGPQMLYRQEALPKPICDIAWKAQLRLAARFRKLVARGQFRSNHLQRSGVGAGTLGLARGAINCGPARAYARLPR